jgi:LuxR family maltose regulon positive regulatory protein
VSDLPGNQPLQSEDLLLTKLIPPRLHASLIQRPALFTRLDQGLDKRLTLVAAPTGFGKTTLASLWLKDHSFPAAWVTLDDEDNDPVRFWRYVIRSIRQIDDSVGKSALAMLRVARQPHFNTLLTGLINELAQLPAPTFLILDDAHVLISPEVLDPLWFFIEHIPPNLHILMLARSEPDWPVALLRARGELNELHADDLRFSRDEIGMFFKTLLPYPLPAAEVQHIELKTEGWAAGIRLVSLAMQGKTQSAEQVIETFNGEHRYVLAYLRKEVYEKQPEATRSFLLQTCLLDRLSGSLCDWLLDQTGSAGLLEQLAQANLFVAPLGLSGGQAWFRYQALFAEAMRHEAVQALGESKVRALYGKASGWYERQGLLEEAIGTALAARQYERTLQLIEQFIEQRTFNEVLILRRWCEGLPAEMLRGHPLVAFHFAQAILFSADRFAPATVAVVQPLLQSAESSWREQGNQTGVGQALAVKAIMSWWQGDLRQGFAMAHQALACLPESDLLWRGAALLGVGQEAVIDGSLRYARDHAMEAQAVSGAIQNIHGVLAAINLQADVDYLQGEMNQAAAEYQQVLNDAVGGEEMLDDQSIAWLGLARIAYERNDLRTAEEQAGRAYELSTRRSNEAVWVPAGILLAWTAQSRGETAQAQVQLRALLARVHQPKMLSQLWIALARLSLAMGEASAARRWYELIEKQPGQNFSTEQSQVDLLAARLWIAEGRPEQALPGIQLWKAMFQEQGRVRDEIEALCLEAVAEQAVAQPDQASQRLSASAASAMAFALAIGQPKGFRRIFLDEGEPLARLLQSSISAFSKRSLAVYATALLHSFPPSQTGRSPAVATADVLVEPLSLQEIRVLRLIAAGLSNPEIASELVVSVNTIKTQVQSIYRKLNVNSRSEAREAAHQLDIK